MKDIVVIKCISVASRLPLIYNIMTASIADLSSYIAIALLLFLVWSIAVPKKRIWPAPSWRSLNFWLVWIGIVAIFIGLIYIAVRDFDTWVLSNGFRYFLGIPIFVIGTLCSFWAIGLMGARNTLGIENGFVDKGPYRFCRNPQYAGDILILIGAILFVNSELFAVPAILSIIGFWLMPLPEEDWLKQRYGEVYRNYYNKTSRFI